MKSIQNAGDLGELVKKHRHSSHLSQDSLARKAGVSRSTIIDLEQGRNVSIGTALKVLAQLGTGLGVSGPLPAPELRWTAGKTAQEIKRELRNGDPDFAMRVLSMSADYFDQLDPARRRQFLQAPPSTGRKRWDALLALTFAYKCQQHAMTPPAWTKARPLAAKWYATPRKNISAAWKQRMTERTPAEFAEANIIFDVGNLAAA